MSNVSHPLNCIAHKIASSGDPPTTKPEFVIAAEVQDVKIGIWGNHSSKVFKHQPLKFGDTGIACDVPRNWMTHPVIMRATWVSYNDVSSNFYCPYLVVVLLSGITIGRYPGCGVVPISQNGKESKE